MSYVTGMNTDTPQDVRLMIKKMRKTKQIQKKLWLKCMMMRLTPQTVNWLIK